MEKGQGSVTAVICNSNMFVPYVLSEVMTHEDVRYLIMSDIDNMVRFFNEVHLPNADVLKFYHPESWKKTNEFRSILLENTKRYNIHRIIFFHAEFGGIINWFIMKKAKDAEIFYCKVFNSLPYPKASGLKAIMFRLVNYLLYGVDMDILYRPPKLLPSLPKKFFRETGAMPYNIKIDYNILKKLLFESYPNLNFNAKVVILTGSTVQTGFVDEMEYTQKTDALIEAIGEKNCVAKRHPRFNDEFGKELELPSIPSYIPGNLIIGNYDVFISNHSTMLVEAAVAGKTAISLIDYYRQTDEAKVGQIKDFYKDRLQGRSKILYPRNISEVLEIVNES